MLRILLKLSAFFASSWTLSRCLYRLHGIGLIGPPSEPSGISRTAPTCTTAPFASGAACVQLSGAPLGCPGIDCVSTSGNFRAQDGLRQFVRRSAAVVWGVLYKITRRQLVRLDATEGIPWSRYRQLWLEVEDIAGNTLRAVTYMAQGGKKEGEPSSRYLTLMREGARAHGLPERYIRLLDRIRPMR